MIVNRIKTLTTIPLVKNTLKLSASNVVLMFLPLVVTPILSRLYTPEDYASWGTFSSVLFIINSFVFLSYENTIVKSQDEKEIPSLILLCLGIASLLCILFVLVFTIGSQFGLSFFDSFPTQYLGIAVFSYALFTLSACILNRIECYGRISIANAINGLSQALLRITFGIFPFLAYGLISGNVFAYIIADIFLFISLMPYLRKLKWT